jgi:hypothetical protein
MLKYRKESKVESIDEPAEISIEKALEELDKFPTVNNNEGSWIDFIYEDKDLQLIRWDSDLWYVDIPVVENGEFVRSLNTETDTKTVKDALSKFAQGQDPSTIFDRLSTTYHKKTEGYEQIPREQRSFAIKDEYMKDITCDCGSTNFDVERASKELILLKCSKCSKQYSLQIDISEEEDNAEPVITFLPLK